MCDKRAHQGGHLWTFHSLPKRLGRHVRFLVSSGMELCQSRSLNHACREYIKHVYLQTPLLVYSDDLAIVVVVQVWGRRRAQWYSSTTAKRRHLASTLISLLHDENFNKTLSQSRLNHDHLRLRRRSSTWQELSGTIQPCRGPNPRFFDSPTQYVADRAEEGLLLIAFAY